MTYRCLEVGHSSMFGVVASGAATNHPGRGGGCNYHAPMPLRIGETFAGYRILRLLGSGGMGEVYLAQHPRLPRHDALKVLRHDVSSDTSFQERFIREADLAAGL